MRKTTTWSTRFRSINILHICHWDDSEINGNFYTILLHGWMGNSADLDYMGNTLSKSLKCHVMVPDLPFHKYSLKANPDTPSDAANMLMDAINNEIEQTVLAKVNIIGYSLGGRIAIEIANLLSKKPGRYKSILKLHTLVLISSAPSPFTAAKSSRKEMEYSVEYAQKCIDASNMTASQLLEISSKEQFSEWLLKSWYSKPMWGRLGHCSQFKDFINRRVEHYSSTQRDAWAQASQKLSRGLMSKIDLQTVNEIVNLPVLYVYGDLDLKYKSFIQEFRELFSRLQFHGIESAGHNVLLEEMGSVEKKLVSFILHHSEDSRVQKKETNFTIPYMILEPYCLQMRSAISIEGHGVAKREGLLLRIHVDNQTAGIGDICPLPGLHKETVQDCKDQLEQKLTPEFLSTCARLCESNFEVPVLYSLSNGLCNAARVGFECALIHVVSLVRNQPISETILNLMERSLGIEVSEATNHIFLNGVYPRALNGKLSSDCNSHHSKKSNQILKMNWCNEVIKSKFNTLKLKVGGSSSVQDDAEMAVCAATACRNAGKSLRLDANREWTVDRYIKFAKLLKEHPSISNVEYIEEPVQKIEDLQYILGQVGMRNMIPIALDETVEYYIRNSDSFFNSFKEMVTNSVAIVVKPGLVGSIQLISQLMRILMDSGESKTNICRNQLRSCDVKRLIVSSIFESGVGIAWNSIIASTCDSILSAHYHNVSNECHIHESYSNECHGLGTMPYLIGDSCQPSFESQCVVYDQERGSKVIVERCNEFLNSLAKGKFRNFEA